MDIFLTSRQDDSRNMFWLIAGFGITEAKQALPISLDPRIISAASNPADIADGVGGHPSANAPSNYYKDKYEDTKKQLEILKKNTPNTSPLLIK